jgi:hypothetical protein
MRMYLTSLVTLFSTAVFPFAASADRPPRVEYQDGKDSMYLSSIINSMDSMAKAVYESASPDDYRSNALGVSHDVWSSNPTPELKTEPKIAKVRAWQMAIERDLVTMIGGGHAAEIYGDGKRSTKIDKDVAQGVEETIDACQRAAGASNTGGGAEDIAKQKGLYKEYEAKLARVMKADPTAVRYAGSPDGNFNKDYLSDLLACEWQVGKTRSVLEDVYTPERSQAEPYQGCGFEEWNLKSLRSHGKSEWQLFGVPGGQKGENGTPAPCTKVPKANKLPANLKAAALREIPGAKEKGRVLEYFGKKTEKDGLEVWDYVGIRLWGKDIWLTTGSCNDKDPNVVCEASGSKTVEAFNAIPFYLDRADTHRAAGHADKCKAMIDKARSAAEEFNHTVEYLKQSHNWKAGQVYLTKKSGKLDEKAILAKVKELGNLAEDRAMGYCGKK